MIQNTESVPDSRNFMLIALTSTFCDPPPSDVVQTEPEERGIGSSGLAFQVVT
ncbi:hypothetical protein Mapa_018535 [Marchantia paleacea]|nr:hypothetical protein Mapa_018535 [Marchantia paleacea]